MKTVHKFAVIDGSLIVDVPATAKVVRFATQGLSLFAWLELDPDAPKVHRVFRVVGTGHAIDAEELHVGSCEDGPFIWHLYELPIDLMAANMVAEDEAARGSKVSA